jgi:hypothetical protein
MSIFLFSQIGDPTIKKISQIWLQSIYKMIKKNLSIFLATYMNHVKKFGKIYFLKQNSGY